MSWFTLHTVEKVLEASRGVVTNGELAKPAGAA